jgi:hypothetical protein
MELLVTSRFNLQMILCLQTFTSKKFLLTVSLYAAASVGGSGGPVLGALVTPPVALIGPAGEIAHFT